MEKLKIPTEEESWENIDELVSLFMEGKTIAEVRAFAVEKYPGAEKATLFCFDISCHDCPLEWFWKASTTQLCMILFPCSPDEWNEYL